MLHITLLTKSTMAVQLDDELEVLQKVRKLSEADYDSLINKYIINGNDFDEFKEICKNVKSNIDLNSFTLEKPEKYDSISLDYRNNEFVADCPFRMKDIVKSMGFTFSWEQKYWKTNNVSVVGKLLSKTNNITPVAKQMYDKLSVDKLNKFNLSKTKELHENYKAPDGLSYFPFQNVGIKYMLNNNNTLLADSMGIGKTIQAIGLINQLKLNKILIVCPASIKLNWVDELNKWLINKDYKIVLIKSEKDITTDDNTIYVTNYAKIKGITDMLKINKYDLLILDESHYIKNNKTQRTKAIFKISKNCKRKILLTGTPILNKPIDLFTQLKLLKSPLADNWYKYTTKFCNGHQGVFGYDASGSSNLDELNSELRSTIMIRRLKKDVLTELPPKIRQIIPMDSKKLIKLNKQLEQFIDKNDLESFYDGKTELDSMFSTVDFQKMAKVRHELGVAKVPEANKFIQDLLELSGKVVVFVRHLDVANMIYEKFKKISVLHTGEMNLDDKNRSIKLFQNNDDIKLIILTIKSGGVGITLTSASTMVFVEYEFDIGSMIQAEDRIYRIGQNKIVNIYHLAQKNSMDYFILNKIIQKQKIIEQALN